MNMDTPRFGFVILHYLVDSETSQCIESIRRHCDGGNYAIVVIDNNSANGSYERLSKKYAHVGDVIFIHNESNEGFARGNNIGYRYCVSELHCDYVVTLNNDAMLSSDNLIEQSIADYQQRHCAVIGPDIISGKDGTHQNPMMRVVDTKQEVRAIRKHIRRNLLLLSLHMYDLVHRHAPENAHVSENDKTWQDPSVPVKLHGSCYIFTPAFIEHFSEPFDPGTFLYMEEDILSLRCRRDALTLYYDPRIVVRHAQNASSEAQVKYDARRKTINYLRNHRDSLRVLEQYLS